MARARKDDAAGRRSRRREPSKVPGRRIGAILILGLVAIVGAWILRVYMTPRATPSVVAATAAEATPEIAELLYEAEEVAFEFRRRFPDTAESLDILALLHSHFGQIEEAARLWEKCIERDPTFVNAHYRLGLIERDQGKNARATRHFQQATRLEPDSSYLIIHLAKSLVTEGRLEEAASALEAERKTRPSAVATLVVLGDAYLQLKQYEKARDAYARTVDLAPGLATARYGLGTSYLQLGEKEEAKEQLTKFQELKARDEQAHRDRLKDTQLGLHEVQHSVAEIQTAVAKAYIANGDPSTAEGLLQRAWRLAPESAEAPRVLAWLYEREGRVDEAVRTLNELAAALPDDFAVQLSLGQLLAQIGRVDEAEQSFRRAAELTPNEAGAHSLLAEFYLRVAHKPSEAILAARKAIDLAPTADHYYLLAMACHGGGEKQPALAAIERAISLAPDQTEYHGLRDAIRMGQRAE